MRYKELFEDENKVEEIKLDDDVNRLSPLTIQPEDPYFDRAIGPLGGRRKDGSIKD